MEAGKLVCRKTVVAWMEGSDGGDMIYTYLGGWNCQNLVTDSMLGMRKRWDTG